MNVRICEDKSVKNDWRKMKILKAIESLILELGVDPSA